MARYNEHYTDSKRYYDWLFHARVDITSAALLRGDEQCRLSAAFHCQQCTEKALKAFLLFKTGQLVDGHNLTWLCKQAMLQDKNFRPWLDESAYLNHYYIETRYPADIPLEIDAATIERVYTMTKDMFEFICKESGFEFEKYHVKAVQYQ